MSRLASMPCCESYGKWVTRLRLACSQRQKQARRTSANESSSWPTAKALTGGANSQREARGAGGADLQEATERWPTPMAGTPARNGNAAAGNSDFSRRAEELAQASWMTPRVAVGEYTRDGGQKGAERLTLEGQAAQMWFTPNVPNGGRTLQEGTSATGVTPDGIKRQVGLENQTRLWATPAPMQTRKGWSAQAIKEAREAEKAKGQNGNGFGTELGAQATTWPTPAAQNVKGSSQDSATRADGKSRMDIVHYRAEQGFSRPDPPMPTNGPTLSQLRRIWRPLRASVIASHRCATWHRLWKGRTKRRLNPIFVEWLMAWPPGHALCDCSETEFIRWQQHMRGALCRLPMAFGPWIWKPTDEEHREHRIQEVIFE